MTETKDRIREGFAEPVERLKTGTVEELIEEIVDFCGSLAITHDSPDEESVMEWFDSYEQIKNNKKNK